MCHKPRSALVDVGVVSIEDLPAGFTHRVEQLAVETCKHRPGSQCQIEIARIVGAELKAASERNSHLAALGEGCGVGLDGHLRQAGEKIRSLGLGDELATLRGQYGIANLGVPDCRHPCNLGCQRIEQTICALGLGRRQPSSPAAYGV